MAPAAHLPWVPTPPDSHLLLRAHSRDCRWVVESDRAAADLARRSPVCRTTSIDSWMPNAAFSTYEAPSLRSPLPFLPRFSRSQSSPALPQWRLGTSQSQVPHTYFVRISNTSTAHDLIVILLGLLQLIQFRFVVPISKEVEVKRAKWIRTQLAHHASLLRTLSGVGPLLRRDGRSLDRWTALRFPSHPVFVP